MKNIFHDNFKYTQRMSQENARSMQPLICQINPEQMRWRAVDLERLIRGDHRAQAVWTMVGRAPTGMGHQSCVSIELRFPN